MDCWGGIMRDWLENARFLSNISRLNHRNAWIGGFAVTICKQLVILQRVSASRRGPENRKGVRVNKKGVRVKIQYCIFTLTPFLQEKLVTIWSGSIAMVEKK